jgi:hypothetical protein
MNVAINKKMKLKLLNNINVSQLMISIWKNQEKASSIFFDVFVNDKYTNIITAFPTVHAAQFNINDLLALAHGTSTPPGKVPSAPRGHHDLILRFIWIHFFIELFQGTSINDPVN